jgi:hypothetical protein
LLKHARNVNNRKNGNALFKKRIKEKKLTLIDIQDFLPVRIFQIRHIKGTT